MNDILDFAQLKYGKFRKNQEIFNLKESIDEIVKIQKKDEDNLVFYHLYIFVKDKEGIKTEILG